MDSNNQPGFVSPNTSQESLDRYSRNYKLSSSPQRSLARLHEANISTDDVSSASDEEPHDYATDDTTPASSDSSPEDREPEEVEDFRDREYPQLKGKIYMDHGGTTLYSKSLIEDFSADMISNLYGNPHSASSPSALAGHRVDAVRERALRFFNADPEEWDLVFTANATAAIKLVIECFRDHAAASNTPVWYGYHRDAHTSLVGVRELTKMHRCFTSDEEVDIWINSGGLGGPRARQLGLFAYPGQSNMTGRRLPLSWPGRIRKTFHKAATYTLLDAAALATTAPLDLADPATAPDFVALSFYKIFGFPNIGALLVRKDSQHVLENRKYFGGGTVNMIISINDTWHAKKDESLHEQLEDGTLPFHSIFALDHAMNVHERLYGPNPMKFISHHTAQLGKQLYDGLSGLRHSNGTPVARIYKDDNAVYGDPSLQGATIAFNVQRADGSIVGYEEVEEAADDRNIFVRSGSLCNPGGVATYLNWSPAEMKAAFAAGHRCSHPTQVVMGKPTGVVRCSLGAMSTAADVIGFLHFLAEVYVDSEGKTAVAEQIQYSQSTQQACAVSIQSGAPTPTGNRPAVMQIPHALFVPSSPGQKTPLSAASSIAATAGATSEANAWDAATTALPQTRPSSINDRTKHAPFVPSQHLPSRSNKLRRPLTEVRSQSQTHKSLQGVGMEIKVRELDASQHASGFDMRTQTPSVKARKFGRSVVNLLHRKGGHAEYAHPDLPTRG